MPGRLSERKSVRSGGSLCLKLHRRSRSYTINHSSTCLSTIERSTHTPCPPLRRKRRTRYAFIPAAHTILYFIPDSGICRLSQGQRGLQGGRLPHRDWALHRRVHRRPCERDVPTESRRGVSQTRQVSACAFRPFLPLFAKSHRAMRVGTRTRSGTVMPSCVWMERT